MTQSNLKDRFFSKIKSFDGCWIFNSCINKQGYGRFSINGKGKRAHRVSWEIHNGPIPVGMDVLHACDTPSCVNPKHLFLGTDFDNMQDKVKKGREAKGILHRIVSGRPKTASIKSRYKGVSWNKERKKWVVSAYLNNKHTFLGRFKSEEEAFQAYQNAIGAINL